MIVVDCFHFHYVYVNELSYYLVDSNQELINAENPAKMESLDKLNNLKWL
jgi:hypothetical protein